MLAVHTGSRANSLKPKWAQLDGALEVRGPVVSRCGVPASASKWRFGDLFGEISPNPELALSDTVFAKARALLCCHTIPVRQDRRRLGGDFPAFWVQKIEMVAIATRFCVGPRPVAATAPRKSNLGALRANGTTVRAKGASGEHFVGAGRPPRPAVKPFVEPGATAAAFVADPGEVISPTIIDWVEKYVPAQIGQDNYFPHLTVGVAKFDDRKVIEAEPFDAFAVHPASVAVYHLGNNGTARKLLKSWPVTTS